MEMRIAGIIHDSIVDGQGLRTVLFVQGCHHRCPGCHNEMTHDPSGGSLRRVSDVASALLQSPTGKVTISGGEPFDQPEQLLDLLVTMRAARPDLDVWVYTGYTWDKIVRRDDYVRIIHNIDVLVDGRFDLSCKSLSRPFVGSLNQRVIDVRASLDAGVPVLYGEVV